MSTRSFLRAWWSVLLVGAVYLGTLGVLEEDGFWIVDNAHKFVQLQSYGENGSGNYGLAWAGMESDPDLLFLPIPPPFSVLHEGRVFSVFSPVFPLLSALPYRTLGSRGLYLLPLAACIAMLCGLARLTALLYPVERLRHLVVLLAGLGTPVWFYSVVFWEHTPAICCMTWAIFFLVRYRIDAARRDLVLGFAAAAVGIYFRDDLYLFVALLAVAMIWAGKKKRARVAFTAAATTIAALVPLWVFHWMTLGSPLGFHLGLHLGTTAGIGQHLADRPRVLYNLLLAGHESPWVSVSLTLPLLILLAWRPRLSRQGFAILMPLIGISGLVLFWVFLQGSLAEPGPIAWLLQTNSLLPAAPFLALGAVRLRAEVLGGTPNLVSHPLADRVQRLALAYGLAYGLAAPLVGSSGIHWGNRFLLALYPLLSLSAGWNLWRWFTVFPARVSRNSWRSASLALVVLTALVLQGNSIALLQKKKRFSRRLQNTVADRAEPVVVTDVWWAPQELARILPQRPILYLGTRAAIAELPEHLAQQGFDRALYLTRQPTQGSRLPDGTLDDEGLRFFTLHFYGVEVASSAVPGEG